MKVIVIRQPWAWLIVKGFKDIENRSWATRYRGALLIQASAHRLSKEGMQESRTYARRRTVELPEEFDLGGIVGMVRLEDCVYKSRSKWFEGPVGWVLFQTEAATVCSTQGPTEFVRSTHEIAEEAGIIEVEIHHMDFGLRTPLGTALPN
jgi:hypothetical protein